MFPIWDLVHQIQIVEQMLIVTNLSRSANQSLQKEIVAINWITSAEKARTAISTSTKDQGAELMRHWEQNVGQEQTKEREADVIRSLPIVIRRTIASLQTHLENVAPPLQIVQISS